MANDSKYEKFINNPFRYEFDDFTSVDNNMADINAIIDTCVTEYSEVLNLDHFNIYKIPPKFKEMTWITTLSIRGAKLTKIENLPSKLTYLDVSENQLSEVYQNDLPDTLRHCNLSKNYLNYIWGLPHGITELYISQNKLDEHTATIPSKNIKKLDISRNEFKSLPKLGDKLEKLIADNNKLQSLDGLPDNLKYLECSNNELNGLDDNELNSVEYVNISFNNLHYINRLPDSIKYINLSNNKLVSVPLLHEGLISVDLSYNNIMMINTNLLPKSLKKVILTGNELNTIQLNGKLDPRIIFEKEESNNVDNFWNDCNDMPTSLFDDTHVEYEDNPYYNEKLRKSKKVLFDEVDEDSDYDRYYGNYNVDDPNINRRESKNDDADDDVWCAKNDVDYSDWSTLVNTSSTNGGHGARQINYTDDELLATNYDYRYDRYTNNAQNYTQNYTHNHNNYNIYLNSFKRNDPNYIIFEESYTI